MVVISIINDEIPKHRKQKKKKSPKKSDHKHIYKDEVLIKNSRGRFYFAKRCIHCGKVGEEKYFETKKEKGRWVIMLNQDEIKEKYKHLPIIEIDNI